jgi:hypothetical protein
MMSSQHDSYIQGYTHATMGGTARSEHANASRPLKALLSSDCTLKPECMKSELLVTACQHSAVNMFPGIVHTARHVMGAGNT